MRRQSYFTELSGEKVLADYSRVSSLEKRLQEPSFKESGSIIPEKTGINLSTGALAPAMEAAVATHIPPLKGSDCIAISAPQAATNREKGIPL